MSSILTNDDIAPLSADQKSAVLSALFVALTADGTPTHDEVAKFGAMVGTLPWGKTDAEYTAETKALAARLAGNSREENLRFLGEVATKIPGTELRDKVAVAMAGIMAADRNVTPGEEATLTMFMKAFGYGDADIARIAALGKSPRS